MAVLVIEIIICIFYLVLLLMAAAKMSEIAENKGWDAASLHVFAWCFWFPIFGYLYVISLPDLNLQKHTLAIEYILEEIINLNTEQTESIDDSVKQNQEDYYET